MSEREELLAKIAASTTWTIVNKLDTKRRKELRVK